MNGFTGVKETLFLCIPEPKVGFFFKLNIQVLTIFHSVVILVELSLSQAANLGNCSLARMAIFMNNLSIKLNFSTISYGPAKIPLASSKFAACY